MDEAQRIFMAFLNANNITGNPIFGKGIKYSGFEPSPLSKEEIMGSAGFTGFLDGIQGKPHRLKGPKGSAETKGLLEIIDRIAPGAADSTYDKQYVLGRSMSGQY